MLRLDHVVVPVRDAAASLAFYREVMGFALIATYSGDDWDGYPWLMLVLSPGDGRELVLVQFAGAPPPPRDRLPRDARHLAFAAASIRALEGWRRELSERGVPFREEDHGDQQSLYFPDPDGLVIEITAPPSRAANAES